MELTNEQLIALIKEGKDEYKEELIIRNKPLLYSIIKRYLNNRVAFEDLYQIACLGLMKAINNYDSSYNAKFSTYAIPLVMGEIKRYFRDNGAIRVSRSLKENYISITKAKDYLYQHLNREPTYLEIANELNIEVNDVVLSMEANQYLYSLDEPIYDSEGSNICLEDKIGEEGNDLLMLISLNKEVSKLEYRDRILLYYRYNLGLKQDQIAKKMNVSQVQVSRLEKKIIKKLKEQLI